MPFIHSNRWDHACRTSDHIDFSLSQKNDTIDGESLGEDLAWVGETLLLGSDGNEEMVAINSQVTDENRENLGEVWDIGPHGDVDESLDDAGVHSWNKVLETSLLDMEQCLDRGTAIYDEHDTPFLSSLMPLEHSNSVASFGQGGYGGVVHDEEFTVPSYVDANISSNTPDMTTYMSSFPG